MFEAISFVIMESDNYIDRLNVDLKLQSTYKPYEAQEAADSIVDKHVLPTVESVLEAMGKNVDVNIPRIEIDIGCVRLQDLRGVLESKLRSALERQMSSTAVSSAETLREFAGTGKAPWEGGGRPFSPPQFLREVLEEDADAVMAQISGFSEKELASLLMAIPPSLARQGNGKGKAVLDSILDRLMRISPETAAAIMARLSFWRDYLNLSEAAVSVAVSADAVPVMDEVGFKHVEIDMQKIRGGASVESEIIPPAIPDVAVSRPDADATVVFPDVPIPASRYMEISLKDIPEGAPVELMDPMDNPGPDAPVFIMESGLPVKYYRKVTAAEAKLVLPTMYDGRDAEKPRGLRDVPPEREDALPERAEALQQTLRQRLEALQQSIELQREMVGNLQRWNEVRHNQPEVESQQEKDYQSLDEELTVHTAVNATSIDSKGLPRAVYPVSRYVEIDQQDIPEDASIAVSDSINALGLDAPDYVMTAGVPVRFFRKTIIDKEIPIVFNQEPRAEKAPEAFYQEHLEDGTVGDLPGSVPPAEDRHRHSRSELHPPLPEPETDIWAVQDFESELTRERIPISDAGLVLLHPFLHLLMRNLGLTKNGKFVSSLARVRAVHLLRDLSGSSEPHFSQNLILEKILCGLPPGYVLPPEWEPDEKEREETEALLKAVCGHWRSLSGSSVRALCDGFILRPGTVERFEETWIVKVEGRTIDILMEDLPWELSVILLPWLDNPISVEWQHE